MRSSTIPNTDGRFALVSGAWMLYLVIGIVGNFVWAGSSLIVMAFISVAIAAKRGDAPDSGLARYWNAFAIAYSPFFLLGLPLFLQKIGIPFIPDWVRALTGPWTFPIAVLLAFVYMRQSAKK